MGKFEDAVRAIAEQEMPKSEHGLIDKYQESVHFWANKNLTLARIWVVQSEMMLGKDFKEGCVSKFFIRLFGIINDLNEHYSKRMKILREIFEKENLAELPAEIDKLTGDPRMNRYLKLSISLFERLEKIKSEYSEEEFDTIAYFRHVNCHPMLTRFSIAIIKKSKKFTGVEYEQYMRAISEKDELEVYETLFPKFQKQLAVLKEISQHLQEMQFA